MLDDRLNSDIVVVYGLGLHIIFRLRFSCLSVRGQVVKAGKNVTETKAGSAGKDMRATGHTLLRRKCVVSVEIMC